MKKTTYFNVFFILSAVFLQIFLLFQKDSFHVDEIFSYGMSNSVNGWILFSSPQDLDNQIIKSEEIRNYLIPSEKSSFKQTWINTESDNHMPVYSILFRGFSLLFGNNNLLLPVVIFNVLTFLFLLVGVYLIGKKLYKEKYVLFFVSFFAFLQPVLSLAIYVRMYLLLMTFSIWSLYFVIRYFLHQNKKDLIGVFIFSLMTILTHYYGIIFCFFMVGVACLMLSFLNKYKKVFCLGITGLLSMINAYFIFPSMLKVGISGSRGTQFWDSLINFVNNPFLQIKKQIPFFYNPVFGNIYWFLFFIILFAFFYIKIKQKGLLKNGDKLFPILFINLFLLYGFFVGLVVPVMRPYELRYFAPIIPLFAILIFYMVLWSFKIFKLKEKFLRQSLVLLVIINIFITTGQINKNPFYMPPIAENKKLNNVIKNADIWWGFGDATSWGWMIYMYMDKFMNADRIFSIANFDNNPYLLDFSEQEIKQNKYAYLFVYSKWEDKQMNIIENPVDWVKNTTGRMAYFLFKVKVMVFETDVYLVCPY
jgi:uncharacterized membrane protein